MTSGQYAQPPSESLLGMSLLFSAPWGDTISGRAQRTREPFGYGSLVGSEVLKNPVLLIFDWQI